MMNDPKFYERSLKKTIQLANGELNMTRKGNHCSETFVKNEDKNTC